MSDDAQRSMASRKKKNALRVAPPRAMSRTASKPFARSSNSGRDIFDIGIACLSVSRTPPAVTGGVREFVYHPLTVSKMLSGMSPAKKSWKDSSMMSSAASACSFEMTSGGWILRTLPLKKESSSPFSHAR